MRTPSPVLVRGKGMLASLLKRRLSKFALDASSGAALVLVLRIDQLSEAGAFPASDAFSLVLLVGIWRSRVYVGPVWRPGTQGCPRCVLSRLAHSSGGPDHLKQEWVHPDVTLVSSNPVISHMIATVVEARLDHSLTGASDAHQEVVVCDTDTGEISTHPLVADSLCQVCGPQARSTLPEFNHHAGPLRKIHPRALRIRAADSKALSDHVSPIGLFHQLRIDLQSPFGACTIEQVSSNGRPRGPALGRGMSYDESRAVAVLEGLERHCGLCRGGRRTFTRAAYQDVADRAIYPPSFGMHPAESYARDKFSFSPFSPAAVIDWVEAYSFLRQSSVLVPERIAFWGPRPDAEITFVQESSNGCSLGSCVEEATLHGLREVVERDSFLLTWYRKLQLPELDLHHDPDPELQTVLRKSELFSHCTFRAFLSTMEHGMPSVWLAAIGHDPDGPAVVAGAGAHPDLRQAVIGALYELAKRMLAIRHFYSARRPDVLPMLEDPYRVHYLEHHPLVNCLPEARPRFSFLLDHGIAPVAIDTVAKPEHTVNNDLRQDLQTAVDGMLKAGFDVLVVDQTMPELSSQGLVCVKVMVPGLLPITFGHIYRRTENLPRLTGSAGPAYRSSLCPGEEPGRIPHPFD